MRDFTFQNGKWDRRLLYLPRQTPTLREHVRYNTFLIFHSGKIIQSGLSEKFMKDDFYSFCKVINHAYAQNNLEEKLNV